MAIQLAPITIVIEHNVARVRTDKGRRRAVRGRVEDREKDVRIPVGTLTSAYIRAKRRGAAGRKVDRKTPQKRDVV